MIGALQNFSYLYFVSDFIIFGDYFQLCKFRDFKWFIKSIVYLEFY